MRRAGGGPRARRGTRSQINRLWINNEKTDRSSGTGAGAKWMGGAARSAQPLRRPQQGVKNNDLPQSPLAACTNSAGSIFLRTKKMPSRRWCVVRNRIARSKKLRFYDFSTSDDANRFQEIVVLSRSLTNILIGLRLSFEKQWIWWRRQ